MHSALLPRPAFGRNIINDFGGRQMRATKLRHLQVKRRIINQHQNIRFFPQQSLLCDTEVFTDLRKISKHRHKPHICHMAIMLKKRDSGSGHQVASESHKHSIRFNSLQLVNKMRTMKVSGCFTCYQKVFFRYFSGNITTSNTLPASTNFFRIAVTLSAEIALVAASYSVR